MLFTIKYIWADRPTTELVFAESKQEAKNLFESVYSAHEGILNIEKAPKTHEQFLNRGTPFGEEPLGDHPYKDGANLIRV